MAQNAKCMIKDIVKIIPHPGFTSCHSVCLLRGGVYYQLCMYSPKDFLHSCDCICAHYLLLHLYNYHYIKHKEYPLLIFIATFYFTGY